MTRLIPKAWMGLVIALALVAAACSGGDAEDGATTAAPSGGEHEPVVLTIQHQWGGESPFSPPLQAAFAGFMEENPWITIEEIVTDDDSNQTLYETSLLAGKAPDIEMTPLFGSVSSWGENEAIAPVNDFLDQWEVRDLILPAAIDQYTDAGDRVLGFPFAGFSWPVWYNSTLLAEAGIEEIPQDTAELIAASQAVTDAGFGSLAVGGADWHGMQLLYLIMQTYLSDDDTIDVMRNGGYSSSDGVRRGLELFVELRDAGVFVADAEGWSYDLATAAMVEGRSAMISNGSWAYADAVDTGTADGMFLGGFPLPSDSIRSKPLAYAAFTSGGLYISPSGAEKNLEAIELFVKHMYTPDVQVAFVQEASMEVAVAYPLDVDPATLNTLAIQAGSEFFDRVEIAVLSDLYVAQEAVSGVERASSLAYIPGTTVDDIIKALDEAYE